MIDTPQPKLSAPFSITRITLLPEDTAAAPFGDVLHVGFAGSTGYAWVKHHPGEDRLMTLLALPSGGPFSLETSVGFRDPIHVGSFQKTAAFQMSKAGDQKVAMAWHVFAWHPNDATYSLFVAGQTVGRDSRHTTEPVSLN